MDTPDYTPDSSRPSIGFPLGTALLLIVLFSLSGVFSCCYHWDKIKSLRQRSIDPTADIEAGPPLKSIENYMDSTQKYKGESVTVVMPGDVVPKFIAMPCPCQPPKNIIFYMDKPSKTPPHIHIPMYI